MNPTSTYDAEFYTKREKYRKVYAHFARWLHERFRPDRVIDLGSGAGYLLSGFAALGVGLDSLLGVEGSGHAFPCIPDNCPTLKMDLGGFFSLPPIGYFDLACSIEVAEHLPEAMADPFVAMLSALAPVVFLTAAVPGQPGVDHINCQPREYWLALAAKHGLVYQQADTEAFQRACAGVGCKWVVDNAMIFTRAKE